MNDSVILVYDTEQIFLRKEYFIILDSKAPERNVVEYKINEEKSKISVHLQTDKIYYTRNI